MTAVAARTLARDPLATVASLLVDGVGEATVGGRSLLLLATPEGAREALVLQARHLVKQNVVALPAPSIGVPATGLMMSADAARHLDGRRRYQPFFSSRRVADFDELVRQEAGALVDGWRSTGRAELRPDLARYAARIAFRAIFEHDPGDDDTTPRDIAHVMAAFRLVVDWRTRARVLHLVEGVRFARAYGRLDERLRALLGSPVGVATEDPRLDEDGRIGELRGILVAAVDTTASALAWALDTMSRDPSVGEAARDDPRAVFAETLRLYPPAWYIGRMATDRVELAGRTVEPGGLVWSLPYFVHRDPRLWAEPTRFDPGRFAGDVDERARELAFLPFGAGVRKCLGEHLAWSAGTELIGQAARALRLRPTHGPVGPAAGATLRPSRPIVLAVEAV